MVIRDKYPLGPTQMLEIALQHIGAANVLLDREQETQSESLHGIQPAITLIYMGIELTIKAYMLQDHHKLKPVKGLHALFEEAGWLQLSSQEELLIKQLSRQQAFRKGLDYAQWDNPQQLAVFARRLLLLHQQIMSQLPLEMQQDYWS